MEQQQARPSRDLRDIDTFAKPNSPFTAPALRALRFHAKNGNRNGFAGAFVNVGRKVLVDVEKFYQCIAVLNGSGKKQARRAKRAK